MLCELLRHQLLKAGTAVISSRNEYQIVVRVACTLFNNGIKITTRVGEKSLTNLLRFRHSFCGRGFAAVLKLSSMVLNFQQLFYKFISHEKACACLSFAGLKIVSECVLGI